MTGKDKGVYGRLKALNPHLINIHCLAHRLALCTSQAASGMTHLKNYQEWMTNRFLLLQTFTLARKTAAQSTESVGSSQFEISRNSCC
jgi:hypothetical protein